MDLTKKKGEKKERSFRSGGRDYVRIEANVVSRRELKRGGRCEVRIEKRKIKFWGIIYRRRREIIFDWGERERELLY